MYYLVTRLDNVLTVARPTIILSGLLICAAIVAICYNQETIDKHYYLKEIGELWKNRWLLVLKIAIIIFLLAILTLIFLPTTNEMLQILNLTCF